MFFLAVLSFFVFGQAFGQSPCGNPASTDSFSPVVIRYTPYMPAQVGPTSTVFDTIITTWFNAVDCRYVTPLRVDENPTPQGPFTTFVRSPTLTITRVGCMPETTAVTRRDIRGQEQLQLRSIGPEEGHPLRKRRTTEDAIDEVIANTVADFPPDPASLTLQVYRYLVSVNTAIFAINLVQSGIDLNYTCKHLRDPVFQAKLFTTTIDPVQAGDIVCFAENNGLYFEQGIEKVVTYLESLIYALQVRTDYPADSDDFCWPLITAESPFLGVDTDGIASYLCPNSPPTVEPTATITEGTGNSTATVIQGTGTAAPPPTGGPFANTTVAETSSPTSYGTNPTTVIASTGWAPYANSSSITSGTEIATLAGTGASTGVGNATATELSSLTSNIVATGSVTTAGNATASETITQGETRTTNPGATGTPNTIISSGTGIIFPNATSTSFSNDTIPAASVSFNAGSSTPTPEATSKIETMGSSVVRRRRHW